MKRQHMWYRFILCQNVNESSDQQMMQSERKSASTNRGEVKNGNQVQTDHIVSRVNINFQLNLIKKHKTIRTSSSNCFMFWC